MSNEVQNGQGAPDPRQSVMFNAGPIVDAALAKAVEDAKKKAEADAEAARKAAEAKARDSWGTPKATLFDPLHAEFQFNFDGCAEPWNKKLDVYFGPGSPYGEDVFQANLTGGRGWFNVPFTQVDKFLKLLWSWFSPEARAAGRLMQLAVMLMPATRTEQEEWQTLVEPFRDKPEVWQRMGVSLETRFITVPTTKSKFGRVQFDPPPGIKKSSNTVGSVLLIFKAL